MNNRAISIPKVIRYVEWIILAVIFFIVLFIISLPIDAPTELPQPLIHYNFVFVPLFICALLSFIFPIDRPLWQRRVYIFVEIMLILPCHLMGWELNLLLFLYIAKSCFLLNRWLDVIITAIVTSFAAVFLSTLSFIYRFEAMRNYWISHADKFLTLERMVPANVVPSLGLYLISCVFVIMFCYLAIAEQKSRQKAEKLAQEVEALASKLERHRIARDIHDSLGHTLTTLDVQLELANTLAKRQPENTLQALDTCKQLSSQCLVEVRRAVRTMRSATFDLNEALQTLIEQVQNNRSLDICMEIKLPNLPLQTAYQLYCITKEGLTNIQKHSQAALAQLHIQTGLNTISINLIDDGMGFNPNAPTAGFGLQGMAERVQILKGQITIRSRLGKGTFIDITVPRPASPSG